MGSNALQVFGTIANAVFTCGLFFYTRRVAKQEKTEQRFRDIEAGLAKKVSLDDFNEKDAARKKRCADHFGRTEKVELKTSEMRVELNHLPSQKDFDRLSQTITKLTGQLENTQGRLDGINRAVDIMNEFLLNNDGKNGGAEQIAGLLAKLLEKKSEG